MKSNNTASQQSSANKLKSSVVSVLGWYGVLAILGAYVFVSFGAITAKGLTYQLLNLTGALGIVVEAASKKDVQPVVLNIVWMIIALAAIIQVIAR